MTREEAIAVFKAFMDNPLFSDVHKAAFSIAIHDIKQRHEWDINKLMLVPKTEWEQESVIDKIKGQIKDYLRGVEITLEVLVENDPLRSNMEGAKVTLEECLELIDKAESEE